MNAQMERLYLAAKDLRGADKPAPVAVLLNESPQTLTNWEKRGISKRGILDAARIIGCSALWLETGRGEMKNSSRKAIDLDDHPEYIPVRRVKFKLSAGISGFEVEYLNGSGAPIFFRRSWMDEHGYRPDALFAVAISGASMEPSLFDSDIAVVNTADQMPIDGLVFAVNYEGELVVKRMLRDGGQWFLSSDNEDKRRYPDKRCDERTSIVGRIVQKQSERI